MGGIEYMANFWEYILGEKQQYFWVIPNHPHISGMIVMVMMVMMMMMADDGDGKGDRRRRSSCITHIPCITHSLAINCGL